MVQVESSGAAARIALASAALRNKSLLLPVAKIWRRPGSCWSRRLRPSSTRYCERHTASGARRTGRQSCLQPGQRVRSSRSQERPRPGARFSQTKLLARRAGEQEDRQGRLRLVDHRERLMQEPKMASTLPAESKSVPMPRRWNLQISSKENMYYCKLSCM